MFSFSFERQRTRKKYYERSLALSKKTGKPLMIIGDPNNGCGSKTLGQTYGCGDICIDITGCPGCPNGVKGYLEDILPTIPDNSYVIFVSYVLEYVNNVDLVYSNLQRISGGDLYIAFVQPNDYFAHTFYRGAKRRIIQVCPELITEPIFFNKGLVEDYIIPIIYK
jgi:hypothetical protein